MNLSVQMGLHVTEDAILRRIERFLYLEAALLDERKYTEWIKLLSEDVRYTVNAQVTRDASMGALEFSLFDEGALELQQRIGQLSNPKLTHAENPPLITRRFVTNILVYEDSRHANEFYVRSNILAYRSTIDIPEGAIYSGIRNDVLRDVGRTFVIAKRVVRLDQAVMFGAVSILL
jgi:3-phenylpropionate/trans-cinnamate dioxygenase beta subunit